MSQSDKNLTQNLSLTTFPSPRSNYATYFNRYTYEVYIYGGIGEDGILGDFWIFNLFKGYWYQYFSEVSLKPAYDSVVCSMLASKIILKIYIYGGTSKLKTIDNMILIKFNIETNDFQLSQFIIGSDFSYSGSQIQYHNRFFYIFSGYSISGPFYEKKYLRDIVKCELLFTNCSLIVLENKLYPSSNGNSIKINDTIYFFFGKNETNSINQVSKLNLSNLTEGWKSLYIAPGDDCSRSSFGISDDKIVNNSMLTIFGGISSNKFLNSKGKIIIKQEIVTITCALNIIYPEPRNKGKICQLSDTLIMFGGKNRNSFNNELWKIDYNLENWS